METFAISHLAIIPDGNRRWAKKNNIDLQTTYLAGCKKMFDYCEQLITQFPSLREISLFFVSLENLKTRSAMELNSLFAAGKQFLEHFYHYARTRDIGLQWVGLEHFDHPIDSSGYREFLQAIKEHDIQSKRRTTINVLIGYDVAKDIERAMENRRHFDYANLQVCSQIDLIIRTGGYKRLSGFLPLNCLYAEFEFIDNLFPDTGFEDLARAITNFANLSRNYGR